MKHKFQISESIRLGAILALSGGFMDAYSYMERGEVFANAQTGNMLLFGVHLSQGDFQNTLKYLSLYSPLHLESLLLKLSGLRQEICFTGDRFLFWQKH